MNAVLARLRARFEKLTRRERGMTLFAALAVVIAFGGLLVIEPALHRRATLMRQIAAQQIERDGLQARMAEIQVDPNTALKTQLTALQAQLRATDSEFHALQNGLVQPQHMGALLQSLLSQHRNLQLLGLRTLPVTTLDEPLRAWSRKSVANAGVAAVPPAASAPPASGDDAWLYRHAVEIRVQGSYADMTSYLQALEALPRRVHWGDLEIDSSRYPSNVMTVTIFTVSLEKSWWVL